VEDDPQQPDPSEPSSSDEMTDYLQIYLDECDEELEAFVESLLTLEDDPHNIEALNEAFRLLHTLKGSSGMMGFEGVSELTHEFENRFETFRTGDRLLDKATMDLLLECVDFLRAFNDGLRRGEQPLGDGSHLIARLAELDQKSANPSAANDFSVDVPDDLPDRSAKTLALQGAYRVRVCFKPGLQLADLKARLIVARLSQIGEIVATDPSIDEVQSVDDLPQFAVIVMSNHDPNEVREIADVDGVESVKIEGGSMLDPSLGDTPTQADQEPPEAQTSTVSDGDKSVAPSPESGLTEIKHSDPPPRKEREPAHALSENDTAREITPDSSPPKSAMSSSDETKPSLTGEASRQKVAETVRVDINRLDRLMNLTGELVVTRARFTQIASNMTSLFRNRSASNRAKDLNERLRLRLQKIQELSDSIGTEANGWGHVLKDLEDDLTELEEQSTIWEEGRQHFTQIVESVDQLNRVSNNLQHSVLETRMVQVAPLFNRFRRVIRDLSVERNKHVQLAILGEKTELDKRMIDELGDPLIHLVRNSIDHGLESADERARLGKPEAGTISLEASHSGNNVFIRVRDDGAGINIERIRERLLERGLVSEAGLRELSEQQVIEFIWHPGFTTAEKVTDISGRGVGMDVVRNRIFDLNGTIEIDSKPGQGATFTIRLPLTLAIIRSLLVRFGDGVFSLPIDDVREIVSVPRHEVYSVHNHRTIDVRGKFIPVAGMNEIFEWNTFHKMASTATGERTTPTAVNIVVLQSGDQTIGLCVDELLGGADIVIKSLTDNFTSIQGLSGASVMGDGTVCLMLDVNAVAELASERARLPVSQGTMAE